MEAELFGYERGAFTDAKESKPGLVEAAEGGFLFLDEIGDVDLSVQGKLLRAIEERTVRRVGSVRERDRKSTRLNSSHGYISYAVFCLKKKKKKHYKKT